MTASLANAEALAEANRQKQAALKDAQAQKELAKTGTAGRKAEANASHGSGGKGPTDFGAAYSDGAYRHPDFTPRYKLNMYGGPPPSRVVPGYNGRVSARNYFGRA